MSPGVILVNRVASRYAVSYCGIILLLAAFLPKLAALLALVSAPVVGAALCVAMGRQVGAGIAIIASKEITSRDYFVVGLPVLLGTMVGVFSSQPFCYPARVFSGVPGKQPDRWDYHGPSPGTYFMAGKTFKLKMIGASIIFFL